MSILRNSAIAALVAGAAVAAPAAASASTTQHAAHNAAAASAASAASAPAPASVHRAHCTSKTFNVYRAYLRHGAYQTTCYAGTGTFRHPIALVHSVTTGRYWGCLATGVGGPALNRPFSPKQTITFKKPVVIKSFTLSTKRIVCPL